MLIRIGSALRLLNACSRILVLLILSISFVAAHAQMQNPSPPPQPGMPGVNPGGSPESDPEARRMTTEMSMRRNADRQKQIVADTAKLLQLAQQLNDEVSKTDKDTLSISVVKQAEEIEKLAKAVKEKMRDGQS